MTRGIEQSRVQKDLLVRGFLNEIIENDSRAIQSETYRAKKYRGTNLWKLKSKKSQIPIFKQ